MVVQRFSICQLCAAPPEIASSTLPDVEPGGLREAHALGKPAEHTGDANLVDRLGRLTRAGRRRHATMRAA